MDADIENNTDDPLRKCDECKITNQKVYFIDINIVEDVILNLILKNT